MFDIGRCNILVMFVPTLSFGKEIWSREAAVSLKCVALCTHGYSPVGLLSQAVHTKNSPAVCVADACVQMHTWYTHDLSLIVKKFLSITAATTNVRWAVSIPKGVVWTPAITCLRSSGTPAARWSLSTFRPQVLQYTWPLTSHTLFPIHTHSYVSILK